MCFVGVVRRAGNGSFLRFPPSGLEGWDFRIVYVFVGPVIIAGSKERAVG